MPPPPSKQESKQAKSEIPSGLLLPSGSLYPNFLIHDLLCMYDMVPPEPSKPNPTADKIHDKKSPPPNNDSTQTPAPDPISNECPLPLLHKKLLTFFDKGNEVASKRFIALQRAAVCGETTVSLQKTSIYMPTTPQNLPWNSCKLAATLVLVLAAPQIYESIFAAMKFQSGLLGGLPTMAMIRNTPSAGLSTVFAKAKKTAIDGKVGKVTVLGVSLVDVEMVERGEGRCMDMKYTSFAHTFVLGVARSGWRVYQAWGKHGYRLDEWLGRDGSQMRDWDAAKKFLKTFSRLATAKGSWSKQINDDYNECFHVDIMKICGKGRPQNPIVPIYRPWVRIFEIENVKASDVGKFTWK
ncbi:MAG: hypothetical protein Q9168_006876 [Polycauliona sp. 1 TL-2023]